MIYRETFGNNDAINHVAFSTVGWHWGTGQSNSTVNDGTNLTTDIFVYKANYDGSPTNVDNVNAGTSASQRYGFFHRDNLTFFDNSYAHLLGWTTEYTVDRSLWAIDSIAFRTANTKTTGKFNVLLRIQATGGDQWVVSDQTFSHTSGNLSQWIPHTLDFTTATWRSLAFTVPTAPTGTGSIAAPGSIVALPAGNITAFGFFSPGGGSGAAYLNLDTYEINAHPVPEPGTFAMLLFGGLMLWAVGRGRK